MTRDLLVQILSASDGVEGKAPNFSIVETHEAALYLGELGRAMAVSDIAQLILNENYIEVQTRNDGCLYTTYDVVRAIATRRGKGRATSKTGFG